VNSDNKRKYFRSRIRAPAKWRVLSREEIRLVEKGIGCTLFKKSALPSPIDEFFEEAAPGSTEELLHRCLRLINNKLDFIIEQMFSKSTVDDYDQDEVIDMSASGLKFISQKRLKTGLLLKMNLIIPETLQYETELIAEIVRVEENGDHFAIAAKIVEIDEEARDSLIKVLFKKQRKEIRMERANRREEIVG
jgi:hypothetical protein